MRNVNSSFNHALNEISASSSGGAPFLICYGVTFVITGMLAFFLPRETSALIAMFQGAVALPAALWLERRMSKARTSPNNPLHKLSALMAVSQALALPFLIVFYNINPGQIPVVMAGLGGVHFLPYGWLHRTRVYIVLGIVVAIGSFGLVLWLQTAAYAYILLLVGVAYWFAAPFVYKNAKRLLSDFDNKE